MFLSINYTMCGIFAFITRNGQIKSDFNSNFLNEILNESFMEGQRRGPESSKYINSHIEKISNNMNNNENMNENMNKNMNENDKNHFWYMGFHRLAINGLTESGMQPFCLNGVYLICNGEIYNYRQLYQQINIEPNEYNKKGSDCLVILEYYQRYGLEYTISQLRGVFAFTIIDTNKNKMYVVRDRIGIRSLYYGIANAKPLFQNKPDNMGETLIVASELKQITSAIRNNVCNPIYNDSMPIKPKHFPPGHFMMFDMNTGNHTIERYWSPHENIYYISNSDTITSDNLLETLFRSVYRRVESSQREVCCLLSGGLDSSLIASMVSRIIKEKGGKLKTFSIGMKGSEDLHYAKMVADHIQSDHTEVIVTNDEMFDAIPEVVNAIETYDTTTIRASVGNYLVCKYIRENTDAKVVFNGDGADEVMGGYLYFQAIKENNIHVMERLRLLSEISSYDVLRSDKSIAGNGLEARTPYLDPEFIRMYFLYAQNQHIINDTMPAVEKELIRNALKEHYYEYLPLEVVERRKEAFSDGVSGQQKSWKDDIEDRINERNILSSANIKNLIKQSGNKMTTEQAYYKDLFLKQIMNKYNLTYQNLDPEFYQRLETRWMPRYVNATDPSARTLDMY